MATGRIRRCSTRRPTISAVIVSCNEADVIEPCLQSVADWVDEIVVVDMHSADGTREIIARYSARLFDHERLPHADPARNFALAQATGDWTIMLDPDERVPAALARELQALAAADTLDVVDVQRQMIIFGKVSQAPWGANDLQRRFFRTGSVDWPAGIHGRPDVSGLRQQALPVTRPDLALQHDSWRSIPQWLDKMLRFIPDEVAKKQAQGVTFDLGTMVTTVRKQVTHQMVDGRAYEDGLGGLLAVTYLAIYTITVYAELWDADGRSREFDGRIERWGRRAARVYIAARAVGRGVKRGRRLLPHPRNAPPVPLTVVDGAES